MAKYVALLRGINVGGNNKVEMKELKKVFESLGFLNVFTYINSGNVIFEASKGVDVKSVEKRMLEAFGFEIKSVVIDAATFLKVATSLPLEWENNLEQKTDILFLCDGFNNKKSIDLIKVTEVDTLQYSNGTIVWNVKREDYKKSGMNKFIGTVVYKNMTARNINTVRKLAGFLE